MLLAALVLIQVGLGGCTVLSERAVAVNTAHVATGALLFAVTVVLALRTWRDRFDAAPAPGARALHGAAG